MAKKETLSARVARLEDGLGELAERANVLVSVQMRQIEEAAARERRLEERIEKLERASYALAADVAVIGEVIGRMRGID